MAPVTFSARSLLLEELATLGSSRMQMFPADHILMFCFTALYFRLEPLISSCFSLVVGLTSAPDPILHCLPPGHLLRGAMGSTQMLQSAFGRH